MGEGKKHLFEKVEKMHHGAPRPSWYTQGNIECIDAIESAFTKEEVQAFGRINAFKYIWRSTSHKDSTIVNVNKAIWFLERSLR